MHHFLKYSFVNERFGDPAILCQLVRHGESLLLDLGELGSLSKKELNKVNYVLVSHTHMDHFIGFDRLLRSHIPHKKPITIVGPTGIAERVRHRILGYTWNLIDQEQLPYRIYEVAKDNSISAYQLSKGTDFEIQAYDKALEIMGSHLKVLSLTHKDIPSIAYQLNFPTYWKTDINKILSDGLTPGPWISQLQAQDEIKDTSIDINGRAYIIKDLKERYFTAHVRSCAYLTDIGFTRDNLERLCRIFSQTYLFFCESSFRVEDAKRAREKDHLTSKQAALIAAKLGVKIFEPFHFSNIYGKNEEDTYNEAMGYWFKFRELTKAELDKEVDAELMQTGLG